MIEYNYHINYSSLSSSNKQIDSFMPKREMKRGQHRALKLSLWVMAVLIVGYIVGRPLYWYITESFASIDHHHRHRKTHVSCPLCNCHCSSQPLLSIMDDLSNDSFTECMKHDMAHTDEREKDFIYLLSQEVRLQEAQALENQHRGDTMLLEAKKMASQFQKEADKCSSGMETCEEAREKSEEALEAQRSLTAMWELRARQRGWKEGSD